MRRRVVETGPLNARRPRLVGMRDPESNVKAVRSRGARSTRSRPAPQRSPPPRRDTGLARQILGMEIGQRFGMLQREGGSGFSCGTRSRQSTSDRASFRRCPDDPIGTRRPRASSSPPDDSAAQEKERRAMAPRTTRSVRPTPSSIVRRCWLTPVTRVPTARARAPAHGLAPRDCCGYGRDRGRHRRS